MQGKVLPERSATQVYVGIDVCKAKLYVYIHPLGLRYAFANDAQGIKRLKRCLEASRGRARGDGGDGQVPPGGSPQSRRRRVRRRRRQSLAFAAVRRGRRALAKTDGVDCRMLAILGESLEPDASAPPSELMEGLQEFAALPRRRPRRPNRPPQPARRDDGSPGRHRDQASAPRRRDGDRQSRGGNRAPDRRRSAPGQADGYSDLHSGRRDRNRNRPDRRPLRDRLPVGQRGRHDRQASLPIACDSGDHNGARHIRGGRPHLRRALYMAALSASRRNPALKIFYDRLIASGKKAKVALTAVMRKLLVLANTLVAQNRPWEPLHA